MAELSQKEEKRATKLRQILAKLNAGEHVQNRMLKTWLTPGQFESIASDWEAEKSRREEWVEKPDEIAAYDARLKKATLLYNRAEGYSSKGHKKTAKKFYAQAESEFEKTLEYLQEIIQADQSLRVWFDRDTDWSVDSDAGIDPVSIPRVATSRSLDCNGSMFTQTMSKRQVKQAIVQGALDELINPSPLTDAEKQKILRKKLHRLKQSIQSG